MNVIKRDKTVEVFRLEKIEDAVSKAFEACNKGAPSELFDELRHLFPVTSDKSMTVEEIQDEIENTLLCRFPDVAKKFIIYRYNHKVIRENKDKLIKGLSKKLMAKDIENQNANVDEHSFGGRIGEAGRVVTKDYALNYCMSRKSRKNHLENEIYIHDLDSYAVGMGNCLTIPFDDLLKNGFNTRQTDVRPANSINTAFQLVAVIFQLQSLQQFGGVSSSHLDWTMVPYVRKSFLKHFAIGVEFMTDCNIDANEYNDEMSIDDPKYKEYGEKCYNYALKQTVKELNQAVEGMYHNLNTLQSRSGW